MFKTEILRIEKLLYRIARAYQNNEQDAEDAVQDALIRAWEKRDTLKDIRQFTPWMTRILSNRCKDMLRRSRKWSFFPLEEDTVLTEMPDLEMPVMEAMQHLKPALRLLITLYYVFFLRL